MSPEPLNTYGEAEMTLFWHKGGCHCGVVKFEVEAPAALEVLSCNCSICRMAGFLHLVVTKAQFRLLQG